MMPYGWHDGGWGLAMMFLSWAFLAFVVYALVRAFDRGSDDRHRPTDPRTTLDERFARGEISEQEYRDRRRVLEESRL